jgi:type II secretory pathway component PulC
LTEDAAVKDYITRLISGIRTTGYAAAAKKNAKDIIIILLFTAAIPLLVVKNPEISYNSKAKDMESMQNNKKRTLALILETSKRDYKEVFKKNIFMADGKYPPDPLFKGDTKKTYTLVGVISSEKKVAVLVDNEGRYHYVKQGESLPGETIIAAIASTSVTLKNQEGEIQLKIFSIKKQTP